MQQEQLLMGEWLDSLMYERWGGKALTVTIDGKAHMVATNGHGFTMVAGAGPVKADDYYRGLVNTVLNCDAGLERRSFTVPLTEVRAWLPADPHEIPCPTCNGGALKEFKCGRCSGTGLDECPHCGHEAECPECGGAKKSLQCHECEGGGTVPAEPSLAPLVPGVVIDRRIVQRFLGPLLRGDQVKIRLGDALEPVFFYGEDWTVLAMPFRWEVGESKPLGQPLRESL